MNQLIKLTIVKHRNKKKKKNTFFKNISAVMYTYTAVNKCVFRADSNKSSEDLQITLDGRVLYANVAAWTNVQSPAMLRESAQRRC